jgi:hypothetical protein
MEIVVSRSQLETLLRVVALGEWMVNAYRTPAECVQDVEDLEQYLLGYAHKSGLEEMIEFDPALSKFFLTQEYEDRLQPLIQDYDNEAFWDGLVDRLADRDFADVYGDAAKRMTREERFEKIGEIVDKYEAEIEQHGVDRLRVSER